MAIVTLPQNPDSRLHCQRIWDDTLVPVTGKNHELAKLQHIDIKRLSQYPAILPGTGTFTRIILEQAFEDSGLTLKTGLSTNYLETIKMMVSVGLGWSILPESMLDKDLHTLPLKSLILNRPLGVVTHTDRTLSNPAKALEEMIQHDFKSM
jgi:DNA-binding transcriptional LysR family regulator